MTTRNTLEDVAFAENFLRFVADRNLNAETRARAKIIVGLIDYLDATDPDWRSALIAHFEKHDLTRITEDLFNLPALDVDSIFARFLKTVTMPSIFADPGRRPFVMPNTPLPKPPSGSRKKSS